MPVNVFFTISCTFRRKKLDVTCDTVHRITPKAKNQGTLGALIYGKVFKAIDVSYYTIRNNSGLIKSRSIGCRPRT